MATKQKLERKISSTRDMASIVSTMKALAAVNVRVFGEARDAIENYMDTVERGLHIVLQSSREEVGLATGHVSATLGGVPAQSEGAGLFVFGAVQGMCGQFSDHIAERAVDYAHRLVARTEVVAVGPRVGARLTDRGVLVERSVDMAGSLESLPRVVDDCIVAVDQLRRKGITRVVVFYNAEGEHASYDPHHELIVPVNEAWLERIARRSWTRRSIPAAVTPARSLLGALTRQYLFASFYRAAAQSLASENAARLSSMHSAESNIEERLDELRSAYNQQRQQEITSELLDIVGGYTALRDE
ncbi:MAG: F0F1 ATP synthase subunit gamma [Spirochaetota bacterium]